MRLATPEEQFEIDYDNLKEKLANHFDKQPEDFELMECGCMTSDAGFFLNHLENDNKELYKELNDFLDNNCEIVRPL